MTLICPWQSVGRVGHLFYQRGSGTSRHKHYPFCHRLLRIRRSNPHPRPLPFSQQAPRQIYCPHEFSEYSGHLGMLLVYSDSTFLTDYHPMIPRRMLIYKTYSTAQLLPALPRISPSGSIAISTLTRMNLLFVLGIGIGATALKNPVRVFVSFWTLLVALDSAQMMCGTRSGTR